MSNKDIDWVGTISNSASEEPGLAFSYNEVSKQNNLFAHRAALYFTPTSEIPRKWVHEGDLDITLPIVSPDWNDFVVHRILASPKIWVDLIQRSLLKIRAKPYSQACITYTRYDYYRIRHDHYVAGTKALTDSLKVKTSGRRDGKVIYYFGIIQDDTIQDVEINYLQQLVAHPSDAKIRVEITSK